MNDSGLWKKAKMVDWFAPRQLLSTGLQTFLSTQIGAMVDPRRFSAVTCPDDECVHDYSEKGTPIFLFDYVADTGESWDGTFTMAYFLTKSKLYLDESNVLDRGELLILGGDQVYPVASREAYAQKLVWPFNMAAGALIGNGDGDETICPVFLVPGNHDWYDGLGSFSHRFLKVASRDIKPVGGFQPEQLRSYFVVKLPHRWQIWAVDVQLGRWIDARQDAFFQDRAKTLSAGDKIILCSAEPGVVYGRRSHDDLAYYLDRIEGYIEERGASVLARLAGDVHNYQHYTLEGPDSKGGGFRKQHLIVSGGGGAFLHPTHAFPRNKSHLQSVKQKKNQKIISGALYPKASVSFRHALGLIFFALKHVPLGLMIGSLYLIIFGFLEPRSAWWQYPERHPIGFATILLLTGGCVGFASISNWVGRALLGVIHGATHVLAAFTSWWLATKFVSALLPDSGFSIYLVWMALVLIGTLIGGTVMGIYLWVTLHLLKIHQNEAFSSLGIAKYKNFLRCRIKDDGSLLISVIAVEGLLGYTDSKERRPLVALNKNKRTENERLSGVRALLIDSIEIP